MTVFHPFYVTNCKDFSKNIKVLKICAVIHGVKQDILYK